MGAAGAEVSRAEFLLLVPSLLPPLLLLLGCDLV
jgi:hypothetical protein